MFSVEFYGCRGSTPISRRDVMKYGGNTTCIVLRMGRKTLIIDCGTGLLNLPDELTRNQSEVVDMYLTHVHWDHIQAIAFFEPFFQKDRHFRIFGEERSGESIEQQISEIMHSPVFPIKIDAFQADIEYRKISSGHTYEQEEYTVKTIKLRHPNDCTGYRFFYEGKSVCILSDFEHALTAEEDEMYAAFAKDCDLMIYDAQYTSAEYEQKKGWGHSTWEKGVEMAKHCGCKQLCLTHHDPLRNDKALDSIACQVRSLFPASKVAREGLHIVL